jgi:transposase
MRDISRDKREHIVALHLHTSKSQRQIAEDIGVSQNAVGLIIRHFQKTGQTSTQRKGNCGRKSKLSPREKKMVIRESVKNPRLSSGELKTATNEIGSRISSRTIRRILCEAGRRAHRPVRAPQLDASKRRRRKQWATEHRHHPMEFWSKVNE